jgi:hypothetical protein
LISIRLTPTIGLDLSVTILYSSICNISCSIWYQINGIEQFIERFPEVEEVIILPHEKPKGKELTEQQKEENRTFSSQGVKCEHAIGGIKRYKAISDIYRNRVTNFDDHLMLTAAGLWNFYLEAA